MSAKFLRLARWSAEKETGAHLAAAPMTFMDETLNNSAVKTLLALDAAAAHASHLMPGEESLVERATQISKVD